MSRAWPVGLVAALASCLTLQKMPPDLPCREAGFAIASRIEECTGDLDRANAAFETFRDRYVCIAVDVTDPRFSGPAFEPQDLFDCSFRIRNLPCEWVDAFGDEIEQYLLLSDACPWVVARRDGLPLGTGIPPVDLPVTAEHTGDPGHTGLTTPAGIVPELPPHCVALTRGDGIQSDDDFLPLGSDPRTIELWLRTEGRSSGDHHVLEYGVPGAGTALWLGLRDGVATVSQGDVFLSAGERLDDGELHHLAATYFAPEWTLYVDGTQVATNGMETATAVTGLLTVGDLQGRVGDVRVWRSALDYEEIRAVVEHRPDATAPDLALLWDLDLRGSGAGVEVPCVVPGLCPNNYPGTTFGSATTPTFGACDP